MKTNKRNTRIEAPACALAVALLAGSAASAQTAEKYRMTTPIAPGVLVKSNW